MRIARVFPGFALSQGGASPAEGHVRHLGREEQWTFSSGPGFVSGSATTHCTIQTSPFDSLGHRGEGTWLTVTSWGGVKGGPASLFSPTARSWVSDFGASLLAHSFILSFNRCL